MKCNEYQPLGKVEATSFLHENRTSFLSTECTKLTLAIRHISQFQD